MGGAHASCLVVKQAVEFQQVLASKCIILQQLEQKLKSESIMEYLNNMRN